MVQNGNDTAKVKAMYWGNLPGKWGYLAHLSECTVRGLPVLRASNSSYIESYLNLGGGTSSRSCFVTFFGSRGGDHPSNA